MTTTASPELPDLEPCPFCGGPASFEKSGNWNRLIAAHANDCVLSGDGPEMMYLDEPGVLERMASVWNRRAQPEGEAPQAGLAMRLEAIAVRWDRDYVEDGPDHSIGKMLRDEFAAAFPAAQHAESGAQAAASLTRYSMWSNSTAHGMDSSPAGQWVAYDELQDFLAAQSQGAPVARFHWSKRGMEQDANGYYVPFSAIAAKAEAPPPRVIGGQRWSKEAEMTEGWLAAQQAAAPGALDALPRAVGVGRDAEAPGGKGVQLFFDRPLTDDELRALHELLSKSGKSSAANDPSAPGTPEAPQTAAARDVLAERQRQVEVEGWTPAHDDEHADGQMAVAAGYYALASGRPYERSLGRGHMPIYWPWASSWWKPRTRRNNLVRAGALMLAEIERLDRAAQLDGGQGEK